MDKELYRRQGNEKKRTEKSIAEESDENRLDGSSSTNF